MSGSVGHLDGKRVRSRKRRLSSDDAAGGLQLDSGRQDPAYEIPLVRSNAADCGERGIIKHAGIRRWEGGVGDGQRSSNWRNRHCEAEGSDSAVPGSVGHLDGKEVRPGNRGLSSDDAVGGLQLDSGRQDPLYEIPLVRSYAADCGERGSIKHAGIRRWEGGVGDGQCSSNWRNGHGYAEGSGSAASRSVGYLDGKGV